MGVATPLSLNNIATEFGISVEGKALSGYRRGYEVVPSHSANLLVTDSFLPKLELGIKNFYSTNIVQTNDYNSGSGTITAPASAKAVIIKAWGGGGGGGAGNDDANLDPIYGGGGGSGGYSEKVVKVTGGSTQFSYIVGSGGAGGIFNGANGVGGGNTTIDLSGSRIATANGGSGGLNCPFGGSASSLAGAGGPANNGTTNLTGNAGGGGGGFANTTGGIGIYDYGNGGDPGVGQTSNGYAGGAGRVTFEWLDADTGSTAEKDFTATITVGNNGAGLELGSYGYYDYSGKYGSSIFGSITRSRIGLGQNNLDATSFSGFYELGFENVAYDEFIGTYTYYTYTVYFAVPGNRTFGTLGYHFFNNINVNNGTDILPRTGSGTPNGFFNSDLNRTYWTWNYIGERTLPTSGTFPVKIAIP